MSKILWQGVVAGHVVPKARIRSRGKRKFNDPKYAANQLSMRIQLRQAVHGLNGFPITEKVEVSWVMYRKGAGDRDNIDGAILEALQGWTPPPRKGKSRKPEGIILANDAQAKRG